MTYFADKYGRARNEKMMATYLEEWHWEQRMFDILNDLLPGRYKAKLENRSYREGAPREGKGLQEIQNDQELRWEYVK